MTISFVHARSVKLPEKVLLIVRGAQAGAARQTRPPLVDESGEWGLLRHQIWIPAGDFEFLQVQNSAHMQFVIDKGWLQSRQAIMKSVTGAGWLLFGRQQSSCPCFKLNEPSSALFNSHNWKATAHCSVCTIQLADGNTITAAAQGQRDASKVHVRDAYFGHTHKLPSVIARRCTSFVAIFLKVRPIWCREARHCLQCLWCR